MSTFHTPTPWYAFEQEAAYDPREKQQVIAWEANGATLAITGGYNPAEQRANAAFIVRACNSHADLLKAAAQAYQRLLVLGDYEGRCTPRGQYELGLLRDAIAAASEVSPQAVQETNEAWAIEHREFMLKGAA